MSTAEERVRKIVIEQLGVTEDQATNEASFVDDLGADSLDNILTGLQELSDTAWAEYEAKQ